MSDLKKFKYDMLSASHLVKSQYIKNRSDLFRFCRSYGLIVDKLPTAHFVAMGYFTVEFTKVDVGGGRSKAHPKIMVSEAGIRFLKKYAALIYDGK